MEAQSQEINKEVPPVPSQTEGVDKTKRNPGNQKAASKNQPTTINLNVSGNLQLKSEETKSKTDAESSKWTDPLSVFTGLLVAVTAGLIGIGWIQWRETRNTAKRQLRAYLAVYPGFLLEQDERNKLIFEARPIVKNTGQTPAYEISFQGITRVLPIPLPPNFNFSLVPHPNPSVATLGSQQDNTMFPATEKLYTTNELIDILLLNKVALYTYGTVTYEDTFGETRHTEYCYFFAWGSKGIPMWMLTNQHQKAT